MSIRQNGTLIWNERGALDGGGPVLASPAGFAGAPVCATMLQMLQLQRPPWKPARSATSKRTAPQWQPPR